MDAKLALELFHGRASPDQSLEDWGSQGPVFLVEWVQVTYCSDIRLGLDGPAGEGSLDVIGDLLFYDGTYYGDWIVHPLTVLAESEALAARVEDFDPKKASHQPIPQAERSS
jgi:hypothetical protein